MLFLASWAVLMGPLVYAQHLISGPRLPFTAAYFGSITMTLVFAIKVSLSFDLACLQLLPRSRHTPLPAFSPVAPLETYLLTIASHDSCKIRF